MNHDANGTLYGTWWTPGNRSNAVRGVLTFDDHGRGQLSTNETVQRAWFPEDVDPGKGPVVLPAVNGEVDGEAVTLLSCRINLPFVGFTGMVIDSQAVVNNIWLQSEGHAVIDQARVRLNNLAGWANRRTLTPQSRDLRSTDEGPVAMYAPAEPVSWQLEERTLTIRWMYGTATKHTPAGISLTVEEDVAFDLQYDPPADIQKLRDDARKLQDLITFAVGRFSPFMSIHLLPHSSAAQEISTYDRPPIASLRLPTTWPVSESIKPLSSSQMAFSLDDFRFEGSLPRWFSHRDSLQTVFASLLVQYFLRDDYEETKVLNMVAAAEQTCHVLGLNERLVSDRHASKARKALRDALKDDEMLAPHVRELAAQIHGRLDLDARLRELAKRLGDVAVKLFGSEENFERWLVAAKRARNDIAHTGLTNRFTGPALNAISEAAKAVIELTLLAELGLNEESLTGAVERRHGNVASRISKHLPPLPSATNAAAATTG
jgi:hypothetical protein